MVKATIRRNRIPRRPAIKTLRSWRRSHTRCRKRSRMMSRTRLRTKIRNMDTIPEVRSHLRGTGPSSYGTGPILFNKIGPVPNWTFS